jgi:hypothetical protein
METIAEKFTKKFAFHGASRGRARLKARGKYGRINPDTVKEVGDA